MAHGRITRNPGAEEERCSGKVRIGGDAQRCCLSFLFDLPVDQSLSAFGVPGALHRDLSGGLFDFAQVRVTELNGNRRDILFEAM